MLASLPLSALDFALVFGALLAAYVIFGMAGFGTALVAGPVLALYLPLAKIVPLLALLDFCAALVNLRRDGRHAQRAEVRRLLPWMLLGSCIGAALLLVTQPPLLLLALGIFVMGYSLYGLSGIKPQRPLPAQAAAGFGSVGGVFSALFGSGGFIYAIYLSGRLQDPLALRLTQTTLIGISTLVRVLLFAVAGVYLDASLWWLALLLAPAMWLGITLGRRLTLGMSRAQFLRVVNLVVLVSGCMLVVRYFR